MMPASASTNLDSCPPRRSPRLKKIHIIYDEDSDRDSSAFKRVKTEVIDSEEIASPSTSELSVASVSDKDGEQDCQDVSLKDLRAQCKAKNRKTSKVTLEGCGIKNQTKIKEEFGLDEPLIALKQKRPKTSPAKANRKMEALTSSCAMEVEDTTSKIDNTLSPAQSSPFKATMHEPALEKLGETAKDLEQSKIAIDCTEEIVGEQICCAEVKNTAGALVSCGKPDVLCEIKIENMDCSEGFGTSSCSIKNSEHSSFELQQEQEGDEYIPQSCFMNQPTQLADVSDHSCEQTCGVKENSFDDITAEKATEIVSSLGIIEEVSNHQKTSENTSNSDVDKSSIGNEFLVCSFSQSCHDRIDNDEYWNTGVVHGNEPESVKVLEELSPIDESSTDMVSPLRIVESDLCGSTEMNCTSLEVVQMQGECQLDSIVCCGVRPKHMLLDMEIGDAATDYTFSFDKTLDLAQPVNFVAQDGRLESIVYDALNNHAQRMTSENGSSVGLPDTAVIQSSVLDFNANCPEDKKASDNKILLLDNVEWPLKDKLNSTIDYDRSVNNEGPEEDIVLQHQLFQSCSDKLNPSGVTPEISNAKVSQKLSAGALNSSAISLETDGQIKKSELFIDEESIEEHAPKKLLSKRKIMSPMSQEKLCNALTGIDLCDGVQRLKRKIIIEDCDKTRGKPQPAHNQDRSMFSTDRRLKGRTSVSPTSKGVLKSTGSPPHQQTTCSCMRSSPVVLDTEKAVEFSQRQMHDIENIAAKLIKSLKHMKSIVDESLSSEAYSLLPNFNIAEVRAASEDALEVEKTTRKWLSIMNKDCNRFCKILSLAKKNTVSHPEAPRKQRKITFADETGGMLCHVKVFKDGQTSLLSECQSDL
ncbi:hypothetical protein BAE44_0012987 [Dichanthelium oligosanthes]|uniref:Uncharacterized protein n=1 Tax=Dichanthelium oligosanthes TaxID=888268 RepID=A0A1E5VLP7_9POAL|nr:hypothetical protein BAE44_0012987 [Dichanthelium oligosanthes]